MKKDILSQLLNEAQSYKKFEDIEKLVEVGSDLSAIPVQPLFMALKASSKDQVSLILPKLSDDQRQAMLDIDIWRRDEIDPAAANWWLDVYGHCADQDIRSAFAKSEDFLLSIKNQCTIQTFDAEDPEYPDSDNYFLTEDNLLLVEYPEDYPYASEIKQLIKDLYTELGVEHAYTHLFKMISDSYLILEEENYQYKKERLRDFGFVDYYDAMELDSILPSYEAALQWIKERKGATGEIDDSMKNQTLHAYSLTAYQNGLDDLKEALAAVTDMHRRDYLQFSFVRLVNARIMSDEALKGGSIALSRTGGKAKQRLELGFSLAAQELGRENVFSKLDFADLYKLGNTLLESQKRKIKRSLGGSPFEHENHEYFLGLWWTQFLDQSMDEPVKLKVDGSTAASEIRDMKTWNIWVNLSEAFVASLPFIKKFYLVLEKLKSSGELQDSFYCNYELSSVDFEAIMLSSLINYVGGHFDRTEAAKMGVTIDELKGFYSKFFVKHGKEWLLKGQEDQELNSTLKSFAERFGLNAIPSFDTWLKQVIVEQMNGYEIDTMPEEDFKHLGGPLILAPNKLN